MFTLYIALCRWSNDTRVLYMFTIFAMILLEQRCCSSVTYVSNWAEWRDVLKSLWAVLKRERIVYWVLIPKGILRRIRRACLWIGCLAIYQGVAGKGALWCLTLPSHSIQVYMYVIAANVQLFRDMYVFCEQHFDGLVQDCSNSFANALELLQSCTKPSICSAQVVNKILLPLYHSSHRSLAI